MANYSSICRYCGKRVKNPSGMCRKCRRIYFGQLT